MKIVVLEKQVPDSTEITVDKKTGALIRDGVPAITNPDDLAGLEAALELKDKNPDTEVVVMTMGLPKAAEMLKEGVAMGADKGVLLTDRVFCLYTHLRATRRTPISYAVFCLKKKKIILLNQCNRYMQKTNMINSEFLCQEQLHRC